MYYHVFPSDKMLVKFIFYYSESANNRKKDHFFFFLFFLQTQCKLMQTNNNSSSLWERPNHLWKIRRVKLFTTLRIHKIWCLQHDAHCLQHDEFIKYAVYNMTHIVYNMTKMRRAKLIVKNEKGQIYCEKWEGPNYL